MTGSSTVRPLPTEALSELFGWPEYLVFTLMLGISAGIGIMYGCFGKKQKTTSEFLMAGRNMGTFPVAMSLIASFLSAITLLGTPAEIYSKGTLYWMIGPAYVAVMASAAYLYLPVFYNLQVTSAYEYLELRFAKPVRMLGSAIFTLQMTIYMAIVVFAPGLALSQVTGMNLYACVTAIFAIVIFYTALGGMKAVMWTDVVQTIIMFGAMLVVVIKGSIDLGGFENVWKISSEGNRLEFFNFDLDPRTRHTVWGLVIGGYFTWIAVYGVNQAQVQRYLTVPTMRQAQNAIWMNFFGLFGLLTICCYAGLVIYARYYECDPLVSKRVKTPDQLFPLFVMDTLGGIPGLPGLFVAGIFSGALSTVSSGLNSLAAITLEDFVRYFYPNMSDKTATIVSKSLSVVYGLICFGLVFVAEQLGGVLQAALSIFGMVGGPLLGVFTLGMFFPWANSKGAFTGTITSLAFMFWLGIGANLAITRKQIITPKLDISVDGCLHGNFTLPPTPEGESGGILEFYRISYMWYSCIGCNIVIIVGLLVSFLTGKRDPRTLDPKLISPPMDKFVKTFFSESFRESILWDLGAHKKPSTSHDIPNGVQHDGRKHSHNGASNGNRRTNGSENPGFQYDDHEMRVTSSF